MPFDPIRGSVENEGCNLHYWYQGSGPLLILIPSGFGFGRQYNKTFEHLSQRFTICTYDRRQHSDSKVKEKTLLNPAQQCRDTIAVIKALGYKKASIFGNSGGGVLAFQFAVSYPQWLEHVVVHEASTLTLLDDSTEWIEWIYKLDAIYRTQGSLAAEAEFMTQLKGFEDTDPTLLSVASDEDRDSLWAHDFLLLAIYCPDLRQIVRNKVSIVVAGGTRSSDAFYTRPTFPQAEILQCPRVMMTGHHRAFDVEPAAFSADLIRILDDMEQREPRWSRAVIRY